MSLIEPYLERILEKNASDLYLTAGSAPVYRVEGIAAATEEEKLMPEDTARIDRRVSRRGNGHGCAPECGTEACAT